MIGRWRLPHLFSQSVFLVENFLTDHFLLKTNNMNKEISNAIAKFVGIFFNYNQTWLVEEMFKQDKVNNMINDLYNYFTYSYTLSTGHFETTETGLNAKAKEIRTQIAKLKKEFVGWQKEKLISELEQDIIVLENPTITEKDIYEWYLIPYWLAQELLLRNEVVLKYHACCWWGRSTIGQLIMEDKVIKDIALEHFVSS